MQNTEHFIYSCGQTPITPSGKTNELIENRFLGEFERNGHGNYILVLKSDETASTFVGTVGLLIGDPATGNAYLVPDLGLATLPEFIGKGFATEAAKALLVYAKERFNIEDVVGSAIQRMVRVRKCWRKSA
jgi:RimJ/RimL family protein N-acetyltransferase